MSYEPKVIILKSSIDKHRELLEDGEWQYEHKDFHKELRYLQKVIECSFVEIGGIQIYICQPEGTQFNCDIRNKLDEFGIEFATDN